MSQVVRVLRNWTKIPQINLVRAISKDVGFSKLPINQDLLLQNLKTATNASSVLQMVSAHHEIMNSKHLMQALRSLFTLQKVESKNLTTTDIINHPDFLTLCKRLKTHSRSIELNETIEALKVISYVGVSSHSTIVQVLLQLIRHNVNQLSLHQIIFLDFLLCQFEKSPLVEALLIALPLVFEIHLSTKMDRENISQMTDYLQYMSRNNMSEECIKTIVDCLVDNSEKFTPKIATSIVRSLCSLKPSDCTSTLSKISLHYLTKNIDKIRHSDMDIITSLLVSKISNKNNTYYNEIFFNGCIEKIIEEDKGFLAALWLLRKMSKIDHFNPRLLDYLSEKCLENPSVVSDAKPRNLSILVMGLSATDYVPKYWESLKQAITENDITSCDSKNIYWVTYVIGLFELNIYIPKLFEKVFDIDFLEKILRQNHVSDRENLILLHQAISALKPEYINYLPPEWFMNKVRENAQTYFDADFPLEGALAKALGGSNYVRTNLHSKLGFHVDHVIVMRKGGYPVAFGSENMTTYIEELQIPSDSQIVLILGLNASQHAINCERITGRTALFLRILESKDYVVVPICLKSWSKMADFEKIPYLMRAIREKSDANTETSALQ